MRFHYRIQLLCQVLQAYRNLSAKSLPSVTLDKEASVSCISATTSLLSTFYRALDNRQKKVVVTASSDGDRSLFYRVSAGLTLGKEGSSGSLCQSL